MIATARFIIWQLSELPKAPPHPKHFKHSWMSDGWETAVVELIDIQKEIEQEENWMMMCYKWNIEERADIGY